MHEFHSNGHLIPNFPVFFVVIDLNRINDYVTIFNYIF